MFYIKIVLNNPTLMKVFAFQYALPHNLILNQKTNFGMKYEKLC